MTFDHRNVWRCTAITPDLYIQWTLRKEMLYQAAESKFRNVL